MVRHKKRISKAFFYHLFSALFLLSSHFLHHHQSGGNTPSDACSICPPGTWSSGGDTSPCVPCGFGYTSPEGATCAEECYPINACPPGTLMPKYGASSARECVCMPGERGRTQQLFIALQNVAIAVHTSSNQQTNKPTTAVVVISLRTSQHHNHHQATAQRHKMAPAPSAPLATSAQGSPGSRASPVLLATQVLRAPLTASVCPWLSPVLLARLLTLRTTLCRQQTATACLDLEVRVCLRW